MLDLGRDAIVILVVIVLSLWASSLLEQRLLRGTHLDRNLRVVLAKFFRALLIARRRADRAVVASAST